MRAEVLLAEAALQASPSPSPTTTPTTTPSPVLATSSEPAPPSTDEPIFAPVLLSARRLADGTIVERFAGRGDEYEVVRDPVGRFLYATPVAPPDAGPP